MAEREGEGLPRLVISSHADSRPSASEAERERFVLLDEARLNHSRISPAARSRGLQYWSWEAGGERGIRTASGSEQKRRHFGLDEVTP